MFSLKTNITVLKICMPRVGGWRFVRFAFSLEGFNTGATFFALLHLAKTSVVIKQEQKVFVFASCFVSYVILKKNIPV